MPPKKAKGKGKKKKGKKKEGNGDDLSVVELYKRTSQEVDSLKARLAERQEYARRSRASEEVMRERMLEARSMVDEEKITKKDISYDLTRQYKSMQSQLECRIAFLESQVKRQQAELDNTREELQRVTEERDSIQHQREEEVGNLLSKLRLTERSYEAILHDALDTLAAKMEGARVQWNSESALIEQRAQQVLLEFGRGYGKEISDIKLN